MDDTYDVIVIGAGPVGQNVTERSRAAGLSVAVVERELVGGECSYWRCVPSKALLRPVLAVADARHVDGAREAVGGSINTDGVFGRRDRYTTNYDDTGQASWVKATGADLIRGHGRLDGPRRVAVARPDDQTVVLTARHAVAICIGSTAALPDPPVTPRHGRGRTAGQPTAVRFLLGWPSSAVAASPSKWPRRGVVWAPRSRCWPAAQACCRGWSPSSGRRGALRHWQDGTHQRHRFTDSWFGAGVVARRRRHLPGA